VRFLGWNQASFIGARIGSMARHRFREANQFTLENFRRIRPDESVTSIEQLADSLWENIGRTLTEMAVVDQFDFDRNANTAGLQPLDSIDRTRPVIFLYPHLGNWELLARYMVLLGYRLNIIFEPVPNRFQRRLLETSRRRSGYELISPDFKGTRRIYQALGQGESIGIAMDEFKRSRVCSPWFGAKPARRTNIEYAVKLARKYNATIASGYCLRRKDKTFDLVCGLVLDMQSPDNQNKNDADIAFLINENCKQWVLANADQWYMLHRARLKMD
jgi:KDO2-lipid IV(A) lauroyltransferase